MAETSTETQLRYDELVADLVGDGAVATQIFGKQALKFETKVFACLHDETLAFKLSAGTDDHADALALPGAALFDPSGKGRAMKDWVAVPATHADQWERFAEAAMARLR